MTFVDYVDYKERFENRVKQTLDDDCSAAGS